MTNMSIKILLKLLIQPVYFISGIYDLFLNLKIGSIISASKENTT